MPVNLKKGEKVDLSKCDASLKNIIAGLRWKQNSSFSNSPIDCDAFALLLNKDRKLASGNDIIYHANLEHASKSVVHGGDNLIGSSKDADCEQIYVELLKIPDHIQAVVFGVNIYQAEQRKQDFGIIQGARIQIINKDTSEKLCIFDLSDNYDGVTTVIAAELHRVGAGWCFAAIGQGTSDKGLGDVMRRYR